MTDEYIVTVIAQLALVHHDKVVFYAFPSEYLVPHIRPSGRMGTKSTEQCKVNTWLLPLHLDMQPYRLARLIPKSATL